MTTRRQNDGFAQPLSPAEATLRLIANLPAPDGLVDRVQTQLRTAPPTARVMRWPLWMAGDGMFYANALRGVAAAAIVCVVAGGGWQIYSHVQVAPTAQVVPTAVPARIGNGFSSAGAMRTPDSPNGPVLTRALTVAPQVEAPDVKANVHPEAAGKHAKKHKKAAPAVPPQR